MYFSGFSDILQARRVLAGLLVWLAAVGPVFAQMSLNNPLVRPASLTGSEQPAATDSSKGKQRQRPEPEEDPEMVRKAQNRITQEDLNIQQQRINIQTVPGPLVELFSSMNVVASFNGAVVLRRPASFVASAPVFVQQNNAGTGSGSSNGAQTNNNTTVAAVAPAYTSKVLRLRTDKPMWLVGYQIQARIDGGDVMVDWFNRDQQRWVNVYTGALQSGVASGYVPAQLEPVDTGSFDYLEPKLDGGTVTGGAGSGSSGSQSSSGSSGVGASSR